MVFPNDEVQEDTCYSRDNRKIMNSIKKEWERFLAHVSMGYSITLADFLDSSGEYLDKFMIETEQKEQLICVGGKLILEPEFSSSRDVASTNSGRFKREAFKDINASCQIQITANLYFQNIQKKWIMKTLQKSIILGAIKDWSTAPELEELRAGNVMEFSIDPPDKG